MNTCSICCRDISETTRNFEASCGICLKKFHSVCAKVPLRIKDTDNCIWYCDMCMPMANTLTNIAGRLKVLEEILKEHTNTIENQQKIISELKNEIESNKLTKFHDNCSETPFQSAKSNPKKRTFSEVAKNWNVDATPTTHTIKRVRETNRYEFFADKKDLEPILVLKPIQSKESESMKSDVQRVLNPKDDPVLSLRTTSRGNVIIKCDSHEKIEEVKTKLENEIGDEYTINLPKEMTPEVKLVGLQEEMSNEEIIEMLYKQNSNVIKNESKIEVKDCKKIVNRKSSYYTVYLKTDVETFRNIMSIGKLKLMWSVVKCYQVVQDNRCYKCQAFDHFSDKCPLGNENFICPTCSGDHKAKDCESENTKCINCVRFNEKYSTSRPTDHAVWSFLCPVLSKRYEQLRKRIRYCE